MKTLHIEGTIDVMRAGEARTGRKVYHQISIIGVGGKEILLHNVSVDNALDEQITLGMSGEFVLEKGLFSLRLQSAQTTRVH